jgi:hypothetical protein
MRALPILLLAVALAAPAAADRLTPEQVECDRQRLAALIERMEVETVDTTQAPARMVLVSFSNRHGFFQGTVVGMPWARTILVTAAPIPPEPETLLSFHLNPDVREQLINPRRTPLSQVSLTREISASNLVLAAPWWYPPESWFGDRPRCCLIPGAICSRQAPSASQLTSTRHRRVLSQVPSTISKPSVVTLSVETDSRAQSRSETSRPVTPRCTSGISRKPRANPTRIRIARSSPAVGS